MRKKIYTLLYLASLLLCFSIAGTLFDTFTRNTQLAAPGGIFGLQNPMNIISYAINYSVPTQLWLIAAVPPGVLFVICTIIFIALYQKEKPPEQNRQHGSARWGDEKELINEGMAQETITGVVLGMSQNARYKTTNRAGEKTYELIQADTIFHTPHKINSHIAVIASTRGGKGISVIIPTLLAYRGSVFCLDIKGENFALTAHQRAKFSTVVKFEPARPHSIKFNPLQEIEKGDSEVAQIQNMIRIIANPLGTEKIDHWAQQAIQLLLGLTLHLLYDPKQAYKPCLHGLYKLASRCDKKVFTKIINSKHINTGAPDEHCHPEIENVMKSYLAKEEKELSGIISTATRFLNLYADKIIARNTSSSDFTIHSLVNSDAPVSLYYVTSPEDQGRITPFTRLFVEMIGTKLTRDHTKPHKHEILMLLDEFFSLGKVEYIEKGIAFFAGFGIYLMLIIQAISQLDEAYKKASKLLANCSIKIILAITDHEEAKKISDYLGKETIQTTSTSQQSEKGKYFSDRGSTSTSLMGRELLTPAEILQMPYTQQIILLQGKPPIRLTKIMYFLVPQFSQLVKNYEDELTAKEKRPAYITMIKQVRDALQPPQSPAPGAGAAREKDGTRDPSPGGSRESETIDMSEELFEMYKAAGALEGGDEIASDPTTTGGTNITGGTTGGSLAPGEAPHPVPSVAGTMAPAAAAAAAAGAAVTGETTTTTTTALAEKPGDKQSLTRKIFGEAYPRG